jgi:cellulose synthase/poly-beta-1,6-N-acetylglucosamine synthase-like glycosyltransferase
MPPSQPQSGNALKEQGQAEPERGLISIILATYNESENVLDVISAVLAALPDPVEIIVVDAHPISRRLRPNR